MKAQDRRERHHNRQLHHSVGLLIGFGLISVVGLLALLVASAVTGQALPALDSRILVALRNPGDLSVPIGPTWLHAVARDITALGSVSVLTLVTILGAGYLLLSDRSRLAAFLIVAIVTGALFTFGLKAAVQRPRPDYVVLSARAQITSFPSGHAMMSAITYLTMGVLLAQTEQRPSMRIFASAAGIVLAVLVGITRLYLGVHWPTDVLAGWILGAGWAVFCRLVLSRVPEIYRRSRAFATKQWPKTRNRRTEWPTTMDDSKR